MKAYDIIFQPSVEKDLRKISRQNCDRIMERIESLATDLFPAQALSKLSRGYDRDLNDVQAMYAQGLFSLEDLRDCLRAIEPDLIRCNCSTQ